nr:hypothetical protein [Planctomycetota bacterium]
MQGLGDLSFYNAGWYGPYTGSLISLMTDEGEVPRFTYKKAFGRKWGVYYRDFLYEDGGRLWTLSIDLWWLVAVFAAPSALWDLR